MFVMLSGCGTAPKLSSKSPDRAHIFQTETDAQYYDEIQAMLLLYQQHNEWHGTPYRMGGISRSGIDCSAFVQITFRDLFGIDLPRSTDQQIRSGRKIPRAELRSGDLVFFRNGRHVGIYLEDHKFLHASTTRGVMISSLKNTYWSRHFWQAVSVKR
ncbi:MAG: NlpC/P60 family protein [Methylophaga sp.]|uniref:NlpC/P60 family protein n=1 Tax=Methylophaga sp. TaxID=2024840 RepID=UPI00299E48BA|nr:NlpC/P60 family protein [Methylophaga sp.]MDX1748871.1 NlpC/P60 family protein [Methylophaga sp.]